MDSYTNFAQVYDELMDNVPYTEWCDYVRDILCSYGIEDGLVLDLGCGTGTFTELMASAGFDMIGVDNAEDMLQIAIEKRDASSHDILYLLQDMREFELYGTVRAIVSICDSMNYLTDPDDFRKVLKLAANYLDYDGIFLFDLNTAYKYEQLLADHTFAENREDCSFIWENDFDADSRINTYELTLFVREDAENASPSSSASSSDASSSSASSSDAFASNVPAGEDTKYRRFAELHEQRAYTLAEVQEMISAAGLSFEAAYDAYTKDAPRADSERLTIIARRPAP